MLRPASYAGVLGSCRLLSRTGLRGAIDAYRPRLPRYSNILERLLSLNRHNQAVAGWLAAYVYRLLVSRDLDMMATYFDLLSGSARSEYITGAESISGK